MPSFGELLREFRERDPGLSQDTLANLSGVSARSIRGYETGERTSPSADTLRRLAAALELVEADARALVAAAAGVQSSAETRPVGTLVPTRPAPMLSAELAALLDDVALALESRWRDELEQQSVLDPGPLPVRWRPVLERVSDHARNVLADGARLVADEDPGPVAELYRGIGTGRLVILGEGGSGKSVLAVRLLLDLIRNRELGEPLPVLFNLGSWHPGKVRFRSWLAEHLVRDFASLAVIGSDGRTAAEVLVSAGAILPVLDGFDEIAPGLRGEALQRLSRIDLPLVLTSRREEYRSAVLSHDVLTSAAVIELLPLDAEAVRTYLPLSAPPLPQASTSDLESTTAWDELVAIWKQRPDADEVQHVAAALDTPLMAFLARVVYSDERGRNPAELLDAARFPDANAIQSHLIESYAPAAYDRDAPGPHGMPGRAYTYQQAAPWLGFLAAHAEHRRTTDLAWWRFGADVGLVLRATIVGLVGTVCCVVAGVVAELIVNMAGDQLPARSVGDTVLAWLLNALFVGPAFGVGYVLSVTAGLVARRHTRVGLAWGSLIAPKTILSRMCGAFLGFLLVAVCFGAVASAVTSWSAAPVSAYAAHGLTSGLAAASVIAVLSLLEAPADINATASPTDLLRASRNVTLVRALLAGVIFGTAVGVGANAFQGLVAGDVLSVGPGLAAKRGIVNGVMGAVAYCLLLTEWGQWVVLSRVWLPLTGKLPWRVLTFLDDAYHRGILRQHGPVHQFRHERLRLHLAEVNRHRT